MEETKENKGRTTCEVWSRVCGYLRPTAKWNEGKLQEFGDRKTFAIKTTSLEGKDGRV